MKPAMARRVSRGPPPVARRKSPVARRLTPQAGNWPFRWPGPPIHIPPTQTLVPSTPFLALPVSNTFPPDPVLMQRMQRAVVVTRAALFSDPAADLHTRGVAVVRSPRSDYASVMPYRICARPATRDSKARACRSASALGPTIQRHGQPKLLQRWPNVQGSKDAC
ncbi:hypothetical protein CC85DRAFT_56019 [Cutaneotrichosporon oleaginosum]|uniref:Uncharacterized protein n=1 Tax=Cutaneotrichosporon oleaginosum TaxID=879819 RepID=A0A0J1BDK1_9TREE|nr:uncharacterized protein CC85DRAFT_56019 [Cutaneotrichosporon oleaginosum]KLT46144.1 hypothetical protein CC85DRAFT_56019 [Cutaneotrichosporon oleaginosum]TXT10154.1 hypothetical protein COLE_04088 [Cutaneotrichosporon oleaginosum]